jgi:cardiolipin synthase
MALDLVNYLAWAIFLINILFVISIIFIERRDPSMALPWVLILILIPVVGFILYLVFGQNYYKDKKFQIKGENDRRSIQNLVENQKVVLTSGELFAKDPTLAKYEDMVHMLLENNQALVAPHNKVRIFDDGTEKFNSLLEDIGKAQEFIHLEYYIIRADELGREIFRALTAKAEEGVEVRLLTDALGAKKVPKAWIQELREAGGKYSVIFPSFIRVNYRNHRKLAIIDSKVGYIGGYNIGTEYLGKGPLGYWRDAAVRIEGDGAVTLQLRFAVDWDYATKEYLNDEKYYPINGSGGKSSLQIVSGGPDNRWNQIKEAYVKMVYRAREYVYIQTPYFIPDVSVLDALRIAALSGVDVRLMIPNKPDHPFVHWASYSYLGDLLQAGVKGYAYNNGFIHAKTTVVDDKVLSIGSANWDIRSFRLNFESNAFIYDPVAAEEQRDMFLRDLDRCTEITKEIYSSRSGVIRFREGLSRLFSSVL